MEQLSRIVLSENEYPIKCDNYVLAEVQKKYGTLADFEMKLIGREKVKGKKEFKKVEPSIDALNFFLPLVVKEGLEIEAELENRPAKRISAKRIIAECDMNPFALAIELTKEFYRSLAVKK